MSPAKNMSYQVSKPSLRTREIHPVWRGVGWGMIILIPLISYAATDVLLQANSKANWFKLSPDMYARRGQILFDLIPDPLLYVKLAMIVFIAFMLYLVFLLISAIFTRLALGDPSRQDPYYVPQMARPRRRR